MATIIQLRRDTAANWTANNPILADGEEGFETDTKKRKVGDGSTAWNSLDYETSNASGLTIEEKTASFQIGANDGSKLFRVNSDASSYIHIPHTDNVSVPLGKLIEFKPVGTGVLKVSQSPGVTLELPVDENGDPLDAAECLARYHEFALRRESGNSWGIYGALKAAADATEDPSALSPADVTHDSLYWPVIYKSSDWPEITTTKDYFVIYSSDHAAGAGGVYWGQFDNFNGGILNGFVESGLIVGGSQAETPWLMRIPTAESGLASDTIFLYYHTDTSDADNAGIQETHLITSTGGTLHTATWTERNQSDGDNVLGVESGETHTGYLRVFKRGVSDYVGLHLAIGGSPGTFKYSTSTDGINWVRQGTYSKTANMPVGGEYQPLYVHPFTYNATLYGFIQYMENSVWYLAIATLDNNYIPSGLEKTIFRYDELRDSEVYIEGDTVRVLYKKGVDNADNLHPFKLITYKLSELL